MKSLGLAVCVFAAVAALWMPVAKPDEPTKTPAPAIDPMRGKAPGEVRDDNGLKLKLVWCPPGVLAMEQVEVFSEPVAEKDDEPNKDEVDPKDKLAPRPRQTIKITPVKVLLTQGYWLGKYEVTQSEWKQVMKTEPWKGKGDTNVGAAVPATFVSWDDATEFCRNLTEQERQIGRLPDDWEYSLPTEAQWERACRARTETKFSYGDDESRLGDYAWFQYRTRTPANNTPPIVWGRRKQIRWGAAAFDMHGNAMEWCRDTYTEKLPGGRDPEVKPDGKMEQSPATGRISTAFPSASSGSLPRVPRSGLGLSRRVTTLPAAARRPEVGTSLRNSERRSGISWSPSVPSGSLPDGRKRKRVPGLRTRNSRSPPCAAASLMTTNGKTTRTIGQIRSTTMTPMTTNRRFRVRTATGQFPKMCRVVPTVRITSLKKTPRRTASRGGSSSARYWAYILFGGGRWDESTDKIREMRRCR